MDLNERRRIEQAREAERVKRYRRRRARRNRIRALLILVCVVSVSLPLALWISSDADPSVSLADPVITVPPTSEVTPEAVPDESPAELPEEVPEETPAPTPVPPWELFHPHSLPETDPSINLGFQWASQIEGDLGSPFFGMPADYTHLGVTTFRGNNFRNSAAWGAANVAEERLALRYEIGTGQARRTASGGSGQELWTGVGWPGQPAIVQWDMEIQQMMNLHPGMREREGLVEVIQAAMDGFIYFFDLETGEPTRDRISLNGEPMKGGVVIDPRGYPILYVGQGDLMHGGRFGYYIFSLIDGSELFFLDGRDAFAPRGWAAFDSNPLIDAASDRMILCGENGLVYNILLNTEFDRAAGTIGVNPVVSRYRFTTDPHRRTYGIENSPAAFGHYLFFADNSGLIQCVDMRTFEPVWVFDAGDDTDASLVLDWEAEYERLVIYTGISVDIQGPGGLAIIRKLDGANGDVLWEWSIPCRHVPAVNGGVMATPILGEGDISDLVIFNVAKTLGIGSDGLLVAFDRMTGDVVWETGLPHYAWSSPVAVYREDGTSYILLADSMGVMRLFRGIDGEALDRLELHSNVEASPAVFGNTIVVATRGQRILGIEIL